MPSPPRTLLHPSVLAGAGLAGLGLAAAAAGQPALASAPQQVGPAQFVALDRIVVPIVDGGRVEGQLAFTLVLAAPDAATAEALAARPAAVRETVVNAALDFANIHASSHRPVDAGQLLAALRAALAEQPVSEIYLVEASALPA